MGSAQLNGIRVNAINFVLVIIELPLGTAK